MPKPDENVSKNDEEQIVEDTDADTRDIEETENEVKSDTNSDYAEFRKFMERMDARMDAIESSIQSVKDAQSVVIDNGAIIRDDSPQEDDGDYVDTRTIAELDLSI